MNDITNLLAPDAVLPRLAAATRKQAIQALAATLSCVCGLEAKTVAEAVMKRERRSGTGIGEGVALPHAMIKGLTLPICGFARLDNPADFQALDGRGADLVVMLLVPHREDGSEHLKALATVIRFLKRAEVRERLRAARGLDELMAAFEIAPVVNAA